MIPDVLAVVFILGGLVFFLGGVVGVLRFPDFYCRVHASGKGDTLGALLVLIGFAIYNLHDLSLGKALVSLKVLLILLFIYITSPTATHALINAGFITGVKPWTKEEQE